jgi:ferredoxin-NADP reductase
MSMVRHAAHGALPHRLVLLYSNRTPESTAFLSELQRLEGEHRNFRLVATMTDMRDSRLPWTGETGMIDEALLKRVAADLPNPIYYVAGPPAMVAAVREALERAGVDGDDVRTEEFYGY